MILFFDCETTGKANLKRTPDGDGQPRLVQLSAVLMEEDGDREEVGSMSVVVNPRGKWDIPKEASDLHGITLEKAERVGVGLEAALLLFGDLARRPKVVAAHNIEFDAFVLEGEYRRLGGEGGMESPLVGADFFCTMHGMKDYCKLPGLYNDYKWPKLGEAYRHAFGEELKGAHDALVDVRACARLYWWIQEQEELKKMEQLLGKMV